MGDRPAAPRGFQPPPHQSAPAAEGPYALPTTQRLTPPATQSLTPPASQSLAPPVSLSQGLPSLEPPPYSYPWAPAPAPPKAAPSKAYRLYKHV